MEPMGIIVACHVGNACHHVNGTCMNGGYRGFKCTDGLLFYIEVDVIDSLQSYVWCLK